VRSTHTKSMLEETVVDTDAVALRKAKRGGLVLVLKVPPHDGEKMRDAPKKEFRSRMDVSLDVRGPALQKIPALYRAAIPWVLPHEPTAKWTASDPNFYTVEVSIGSRHNTQNALKQLDDFARDKRDPLLILDFTLRGGLPTKNRTLLYPTRASLLARSLRSAGSTSAGATGKCALKRYPKRGANSVLNAAAFTRWMCGPLLWIYVCWCICFDPDRLPYSADTWPRLFDLNGRRIVDVLPLHPTTMTQAFALGAVYRELVAADIGSVEERDLLIRAQKVVGRTENVTRALVMDLPRTLRDMEDDVGLVTRVIGFFTFVNCMWLLAIVGISVTVLPFVWIFTKPLRRILQDVLVLLWNSIVRVVKYVWSRIVRPTLIRMHVWGVFEIIGWCVSILLVENATEASSSDVGFYVALSALFLAAFMAAYATLLFGGRFVREMSPQRRHFCISTAVAVFCTPICIRFESQLLGYVIVWAVYGVLGFSVACYGLCYVIGFRSESAIERVTVASGVLLFCIVSMRACNVQGSAWSALSSPCSVMGSLTLFLGLLIVSSRRYNYESSRNGHSKASVAYLWRNTLFVVLGTMALFLGQIFRISGMSNTVTVFLIMYAVEKWVEIHFDVFEWNPILFAFPFFCVLYKAALYLHQDPGFVVSLMSFDILSNGL